MHTSDRMRLVEFNLFNESGNLMKHLSFIYMLIGQNVSALPAAAYRLFYRL